MAVMSTGGADSERIVSSRALVFADLVDAGLSFNALVSSCFAFIDVNASFWSIGAVSKLSAVLSVSVSVVTGDAVTVVASLGVRWSADGHSVALVSTESARTFMTKTSVRSRSIGTVLQGTASVISSRALIDIVTSPGSSPVDSPEKSWRASASGRHLVSRNLASGLWNSGTLVVPALAFSKGIWV